MIEGIAKHWKAYSDWKTEHNQKQFDPNESYLIQTIGANKQSKVYHQDSDTTKNQVKWHNHLYSFKNQWEKSMSYSDFIQKVKTENIPGQHVLRQSWTVHQRHPLNSAEIAIYLEGIEKDI